MRLTHTSPPPVHPPHTVRPWMRPNAKMRALQGPCARRGGASARGGSCTLPLHSPHVRIGPHPRSHRVGRVHWWGAGMREPRHPHPSLDPAQIGGPLRPPSLTLTPPSAGLDDFEAKSAEGQARVGHRVLRRGLLPGVPGAHQFHRKSLRCTAPSKPTSNSLILASFCLRRPSRLLPASGVRISRFLPACARRKQAQ